MAVNLEKFAFMIARRDVGASTRSFEPMSTEKSTDLVNGKVQLTGLTQLDGEYVVLVSTASSEGEGSSQGSKTASMISAAGPQSRANLGGFGSTALFFLTAAVCL